MYNNIMFFLSGLAAGFGLFCLAEAIYEIRCIYEEKKEKDED